MQIAIISDIHDHVWNLRAAMRLAQTADVLLCCGDLCSPFIVPLMADAFAGPIHVVFGNNDGDLYRITRNAQRYGERMALHGELAEVEFDGRRVAMQHFDNIARVLADSGRYDVVCFGHNHRLEIGSVGATQLINPGTLLGYDPAAREDVPPTFVLYDTAANAARVVHID